MLLQEADASAETGAKHLRGFLDAPIDLPAESISTDSAADEEASRPSNFSATRTGLGGSCD